MLSRWCNEINSINLAFFNLKRICRKSNILKGGRGRKPKREIEGYAFLISLKEFDKRTLRGAEEHLSKFVFDERVDHSVIAYWEKNPKMLSLVAQFIAIAGALLNKALSTLFTFVDSTKFSSWNINEINVTVCNKIAKETVYPIGISFKKADVVSPVNESVPSGDGKLYADAWYDEIETIKSLFKKGYTPIICPNKIRYRGFYRRKARELYKMPENRLGYRQRGRGESLFGSLTNCYGDRLNARKASVMKTRIASRILCYQIKLLIRINSAKALFIRHAPSFLIFKNHEINLII
jgi:hypothetical protein